MSDSQSYQNMRSDLDSAMTNLQIERRSQHWDEVAFWAERVSYIAKLLTLAGHMDPAGVVRMITSDPDPDTAA